MKRILVTGAGGYIGSAFLSYIGQFPEAYQAEGMSLRGGTWRNADFSKYDAIVHAAGLAHVRETEENRARYFEVNRDLTAETAEKACAEGVGQFLFLSSLSVYGIDEGIITPDTVPRPGSSYGRSKLEAEERLLEMETARFKVAILRPPMVYGEGCKGNYQALVKLAEILPVCPDYENQRSAISIENLCAFIRETIDEEAHGIFCPQDPAYFCTCRAIRQIAERRGRHLPLTGALNFGPACLRRFTKSGRKAFGDLVYQDEGQCGDAGVQRGEVHRGGDPVGAGADVGGA